MAVRVRRRERTDGRTGGRAGIDWGTDGRADADVRWSDGRTDGRTDGGNEEEPSQRTDERTSNAVLSAATAAKKHNHTGSRPPLSLSLPPLARRCNNCLCRRHCTTCHRTRSVVRLQHDDGPLPQLPVAIPRGKAEAIEKGHQTPLIGRALEEVTSLSVPGDP